MSEAARPRYVHDCKQCTFLGRYLGPDNVDLYHCMQDKSQPTVIARHSSEPSDYESGLSCYWHFSLREAKRRAQKRGLPLEAAIADQPPGEQP